MKISYNLEKDENTGQLTIKEYGELDKDLMGLLCEVTLDRERVLEAIGEGVPALIAALRSDDMYPPGPQMQVIAESVMAMYAPDGASSANVVFDDREMMIQEREKSGPMEEIKESVDLDIEDEPDDELDDLLDNDDIKIKNTTTSLKIADDDSVDIDEDA